ncbi:glycoside hydrolase family 73 protein [Lonepinella koalarum]|uniref:glycoside hydrolase family 73 protein n=1 Tax=Lonepinella koalarum TaxID=53417 RepID=UPI003F6E1916
MATEQQQKAFQQILMAAQNAGVAHPEVIAAQWALESGWGSKVSGKNNYWGIKAGNGDPNNDEQGTVVWTHENINGDNVNVQQKFRDYDSLEDAIKDRASFTAKPGGRYDKAGYFTASSPAEAARALSKAGYATDPEYAQKLISIMRSGGVDPYNGQQYDYSTVNVPNVAQQSTPPLTNNIYAAFNPQGNQTAQNNPFSHYFNQLNGTLEPLSQEVETPAPSNRQKYQSQLAAAFGVTPQANNGMPDYIGDLVKSIYDQA